MNRDNQNIIQSNAGLAIGKPIQIEVLKYERTEYGRRILATLSQELSAEYGRGYSYSALTWMVKLHETVPGEEIVAALRRQSPIRFARTRTTESSDNRPISRSESAVIVRSGPINYQGRYISRTTMSGSLLSNRPESITHVANTLLRWKEADVKETDKALWRILEKIGV